MEGRPVLYVVASGAAPARELPTLIAALTDVWETCVITTALAGGRQAPA